MSGMVSDVLLTLHRTCSATAPGINDSEGNAKRVMLFGTALLTTIDILIQNNLFKSENSQIRNIALILGHFLHFAHDMKEVCRANEDGWKRTVLVRADEHGIELESTSTDYNLSDISEYDDHAIADEDVPLRPQITSRREGLKIAAGCYESKPYVGLITLESLTAGVRRSWTHWDWAREVWPAFFSSDLGFHNVCEMYWRS